MKKVILALGFLSVCSCLGAQGIINKIKNKLNQPKTPKTEVSSTQVASAPVANVQQPAQDTTPVTTTPVPAGNQAAFKAYNNYDFVPGEKILFEDNFATDQDGEFPQHWNLGAGQAVVNTMDSSKVFLLIAGNFAHVSPLLKKDALLRDTFSIEFDSYTTGGYGPRIYFYNTVDDATKATHDLGQVNICQGNIWEGVQVSVPSKDLSLDAKYPPELIGKNYKGKWHHIAIAYKNNQLKVYVDQNRILVVPALGISPRAFDIEGIGESDLPIFIKNVRVANGGNFFTMNQQFTGAKIVTHGINFDYNKATIRPESMGALNQIMQVMTGNPTIRFEVGGHTDGDGDANYNLKLSQQRADAVRAQLINMGIDGARLTTKGYGKTKPISDNTTPEGKANNRRVEFVKLP